MPILRVVEVFGRRLPLVFRFARHFWWKPSLMRRTTPCTRRLLRWLTRLESSRAVTSSRYWPASMRQ